MESSNKTRNDQEKKKIVIKLGGGGGGGGGIGTVLLFGGALATAALASAFVFAVKARDSTKDRRRRDQSTPPENSKQTEENGANKAQEIITTGHQHSHVFEHPSKGEKKEVKPDNGTEAFLVSSQSSILDEEEKIEINGGTPGDIDKETEVKLIKEDIGNEGAEIEKNDDGESEVMNFREGVDVSGTQTRQEENGVEGVQIDQTALKNMELNMEKEEVEGLYSSIDGEICEEKECVEFIGSAKGLSEHGSNQEALSNVDSMLDIVVSDSHIGGGGEEKEEEGGTLIADYESHVIECENVDGDVEESAFHAEAVEIVQEEEAVGGSREDKVKCDNEKLVEEEKIVPMIEELIHEDNEVIRKEDAANANVIDGLEVYESKTLLECDAMTNVKKKVVDEMICHENIEATIDDIVNEEADDTQEESENKSRQKDEQEKEEDGLTKESSNEEEEEGAHVNDEIEEEGSVETSDSSTESNSEAVWPAESLKVKMVKYEVEGKIEEDKTVEEDENDNQRKYQRSSEKLDSSKKSFINKNMVEKGMVIGILLLLSWSWFFGLSLVKLCLVLFLTMLVSEIHGY